MKKLSNLLHQVSTGWATLISLVVFLVFTATVLPAQASRAEAYSTEVGSPDTSFFYGSERLYQFAEAYGPEGREAYVRARLTFDVIWPLVYAAFLISSISWLTKRTNLTSQALKCLNLIPIFGMGFDFLENAAAAITIARYPNRTPILADLAGWFTAIKWFFVGSGFAALLFLIVLAVIRLFRGEGIKKR